MLQQIGNELREARERRGISIADAQAETKIRSRYLEALEQGQLNILPGDVYTKGFLRTYAEFLGLDGKALVDRYKQWQQEQEAAATQSAGGEFSAPAAAPVARPPKPKASPKPQVAAPKAVPETGTGRGFFSRTTWAVMGGLLVVSIVVGGWLAWRNVGPAQGSPAPEPGTSQPAPNPPQPGTSAGTGGTGAEGPGALTGVSLKAVTPPDAYTLPYTIEGAAGRALQLSVVARDSCWIRLERDGAAAVEETLSAGATRTWDLTGGASIKLGNPPGVSLKVDGTALPDSAALYPITYVFSRS